MIYLDRCDAFRLALTGRWLAGACPTWSASSHIKSSRDDGQAVSPRRLSAFYKWATAEAGGVKRNPEGMARLRIAVRYLLERGELSAGSQVRLAEYYGVSRQRVHQIVVEERGLLDKVS